MTEKDLKQIKFLKIEIERIEKIIKELNNADYNSCLKNEYIKKLSSRREELLGRKIEAEEYINTIEDGTIRIILQLRFVDLRSWNYISKVLHYDRTSLFYKYKKYLDSTSKTNSTKINI